MSRGTPTPELYESVAEVSFVSVNSMYPRSSEPSAKTQASKIPRPIYTHDQSVSGVPTSDRITASLGSAKGSASPLTSEVSDESLARGILEHLGASNDSAHAEVGFPARSGSNEPVKRLVTSASLHKAVASLEWSDHEEIDDVPSPRAKNDLSRRSIVSDLYLSGDESEGALYPYGNDRNPGEGEKAVPTGVRGKFFLEVASAAAAEAARITGEIRRLKSLRAIFNFEKLYGFLLLKNQDDIGNAEGGSLQPRVPENLEIHVEGETNARQVSQSFIPILPEDSSPLGSPLVIAVDRSTALVMGEDLGSPVLNPFEASDAWLRAASGFSLSKDVPLPRGLEKMVNKLPILTEDDIAILREAIPSNVEKDMVRLASETTDSLNSIDYGLDTF